jgi:CobQ-like glutamine amidotransferase family enzyme
MSKQLLRILQLYPKDMNIYGDWGNVLTLQRRAQWHGYDVDLLEYNPGNVFPKQVDLIVGGGGQDSGQIVVQNDLAKIGSELKKSAEAGTPMLVICGLYQLFGNFFKTKDGEIIQGIGLFDIETHGGPERLIGNIVTHSDEFGGIVGYENHSGLTYLSSSMQPLGKVIKGAGNNGQDEFEGARVHNVIGSYLHGSLLPKNPVLADWLIEQAAIKKYGEAHLTIIDDSLANAARDVAIKRPR